MKTQLDALRVISLSPTISAWLEANDPKALEQVRAAITQAESARREPDTQPRLTSIGVNARGNAEATLAFQSPMSGISFRRVSINVKDFAMLAAQHIPVRNGN